MSNRKPRTFPRAAPAGDRERESKTAAPIWKGLQTLLAEMQEQARSPIRSTAPATSIAEMIQALRDIEAVALREALEFLKATGRPFGEDELFEAAERFARHLRRRIGVLPDPVPSSPKG